MKIAVFASLLAHAAAFAPANQASKPSITAAPAAIDDMYGAIDYRCKEYKFDPLKLGTTYEPLLPWFRECEIRHGRTAMLAVLGLCVPDIVRVPGEQFSFEAIPRTIDAHDALYTTAEYQLFLFVGIWDLVVTAPACAEMMKGGREPGGKFEDKRGKILNVLHLSFAFVLLTQRWVLHLFS